MGSIAAYSTIGRRADRAQEKYVTVFMKISTKQQSPTAGTQPSGGSSTLGKFTMALFPIATPKAHSLTGRITRPLLLAAFKAVKRNRGAAGIDKVSVKMFDANLAENLSALERALKSGSY